MTGSRFHLAPGVIALFGFLGLAAATACTSDPTEELQSVPTRSVGDPAAGSATSTSRGTTTTASPTTTLRSGQREMAAVVAAMSPAEKARQLVASGVRGDQLADAIDAAAGSRCIGAVFITETNANWRPDDSMSSARAAISTISSAAADEGCVGPPLVMTDAETGSLLRLPIPPLESAPTLGSLYAADRDDALQKIATEGGAFVEDLRELGVHVNLGVVADVDIDPTYYMARRRRTFGADPTVVAEISTALVDAHCSGGVAATLKHFPNQGATPEDPQTSRSNATGGEEGWSTVGQIPYIDTRAPLVMTGHIFMDTDPERPATLSHDITTGLLRDQLGYDGVVVTDDLFAMRGIADVVPNVADRAVEAIAAGADLALFVVEDELDAVITAIVDRVSTDPSFATRVDESVTRVLGLKAAFGLIDTLDPDWFPLCD